jgi:phenylacetate-CoA ligase
MKTALLKHATRLPDALSLPLMFLNRSAQKVYGQAYWRHRQFLQQTLSEYDPTPVLVESVNRALKEIPYYQKLYGKGLIQSQQQFQDTFGFVEKETILEHFEEFINPNVDLNYYDHGTTGGTSGKPLQLIAPKNRYVVELATMHTLWGRAGYNFNPRAVIRNHKLDRGKDYIVNPITREIIFDGFRLEADYFELIFRTIKKFNIRFVHCYPSTAYEFSTFLLNKGYDTSFIKAFLSGSENIFHYQVDLIQKRLGIRFYNWYGHSEKLILAGYCENTNLYHVEPTYGYFELIDENNRQVREPGKVGEMVGTGFHNPGMVLIRYRTGDFAEYAGDYCPSCKRHVTLLKNIRGRWSGDKLFNADGTYLTTTALNLHSDLYSVINGMQYMQEKKGEIKILIIKSLQYTERHERALYKHFCEKFKPGTDIKIEYVDKLRKLPNGKFVHIISTVKE